MATQTRSNKKKKKLIQTVLVHIKATFNNTNITVSDEFGNVVAWATAGKAGFKGSRKTLLMQQLLLQRKSQVK